MLETIFSIILMILKIIGIIILAVLGLILTLILLVLFVPIRYRASAKKYEELSVKGSVSWLLHIIHVGVVYDGELRVAVRVFGIPVKRIPTRKKAATEQSVPEVPVNGNGNKAATEQSVPESPDNIVESEQTGKESAGEKKQRKSIKQIFENIVNGIVEKVKSIYNKLRSLLQTVSDVKAFIDNERNRAAFSFIKDRLIHVVKHIAPRRMKGYVRFGLEDPSGTGYVLALLGVFYGKYGNNVNIVPDFTEKCFEGDFKVKGRIRLFTLGLDGLKVIMNKDVKYLRKSFNKLKKGFDERKAA